MDQKVSLADANIDNSNSVSAHEPEKENIDKSIHTEVKPEEKIEPRQEIKPAGIQKEIKRSNNDNKNQDEIKFNRKLSISKKLNILKRYLKYHFSISHIQERITHYISEYRRVMMLTRKPTKQEYKELAVMVTLGTLIIGGIGFIIQLIIQFI